MLVQAYHLILISESHRVMVTVITFNYCAEWEVIYLVFLRMRLTIPLNPRVTLSSAEVKSSSLSMQQGVRVARLVMKYQNQRFSVKKGQTQSRQDLLLAAVLPRLLPRTAVPPLPARRLTENHNHPPAVFTAQEQESNYRKGGASWLSFKSGTKVLLQLIPSHCSSEISTCLCHASSACFPSRCQRTIEGQTKK